MFWFKKKFLKIKNSIFQPKYMRYKISIKIKSRLLKNFVHFWINFLVPQGSLKLLINKNVYYFEEIFMFGQLCFSRTRIIFLPQWYQKSWKRSRMSKRADKSDWRFSDRYGHGRCPRWTQLDSDFFLVVPSLSFLYSRTPWNWLDAINWR